MREIKNRTEFVKSTRLFVVESEKNYSLDDYKNKYGSENVFQFNNIEFPFDVSNPLFIEIDSFLSKNLIDSNSKVVAIYKDLNLENINEDDIFSALISIHRECNTYKNRQGQEVSKIELDSIYFINCNFREIKRKELIGRNNVTALKTIYYKYCQIANLYVRMSNSSDFFYSCFQYCTIINLYQTMPQMDFTFKNNKIHFLNIESKKIYLQDLQIILIYHHNIEEVQINADNVTIEFNSKIVKNLDKNLYPGILNTFTYTSSLNSFHSSKFAIEKYIHFFKSRKDFIAKFLYIFNGGYTKILRPLFVTTILFTLNLLLLYYLQNGQLENVYYLIFPIDLFKKLIFTDISFENSFSCVKMFLSITELLFIYSFFSLSFAIKKRYGFKL